VPDARPGGPPSHQPDRPDDADPPERAGLQVAREALAAARAAARGRGAAARGGQGSGQAGRGGGPGSRARRAAAGRRSGAHPDDRDPQPLGSTIARLLAERGWELDVAVGAVLGRWDQIVGEELAAHCRPEAFEEGVLTVRADSTAWATQVRLLAPALLARLAAEVGAGTVARVVVLGPTAPSWVRGQLRVPGRGPRDTYG
jgi:predicted nucleic acid-binding Zn ribbon protein